MDHSKVHANSLYRSQNQTIGSWFRSGEPWIWVTGSAVAVSVIAVVGLLLILAVRGLGHFWPSNIVEFDYVDARSGEQMIVAGQLADSEQVSLEQLNSSGLELDASLGEIRRRDLMKTGNRDLTGADFRWYLYERMSNIRQPDGLMVIERREWGNFYGYLLAVKEAGTIVTENSAKEFSAPVWEEFQSRLQRALELNDTIQDIEKNDTRALNYRLEKLRLDERGLELQKDLDDKLRQIELARITEARAEIAVKYEVLQETLNDLHQQIERDSFTAVTATGQEVELTFAKVVHALLPNQMSAFDKVLAWFAKLAEFLSEDPREANTEGGVYPAIFGTVLMVLLMSIMVTPFGVVAAVYLREYAKQGVITRTIRIAVNNLAGVPSIVYGVFGLGFFVYGVGEQIDHLFFEAALPAPTFGTPGLLWASLTLAILTVPVVIVATEEGLARIPRSVREGSLALGATKAETLWRVVLPMASPAMMTGVILAVARAAGEVAPLMLVGVVKLAPALPLDGNFPFLHLDQKFMHLGFHIYDVGFQSPNVEAARPLVYATALLLVVVIAVLNFSAVSIRNRLREKYKALEH
ncbi:MAG: phosphate ABC transporter permease PstA [Pseudomonadota bacterium]